MLRTANSARGFWRVPALAGLLLATAVSLLSAQYASPPKPKDPPKTVQSPVPAKDILTTLASAGNFKTLLGAIDAAGLTSTLGGAGPYTLFAPTDEAFGRMPKEQLDALLNDRGKLAALLKAHIVRGRLGSADLAKSTTAISVGGDPLTLDNQSGLAINGVRIVGADLPASNGVILAIDQVLAPTHRMS
jgi:uncharacterized surface protein with fasciclin (FAS1) repeats